MQPSERDRDPSTNPVDVSTEEGPALRDADAVTRRAAEDEAAAAAARAHLRDHPLDVLPADDRIGPHLAHDEVVHALRARAILRAPGGDTALGYGGTLYLTSRRLIHMGQVVVSVNLTDITETSMAGEQLLLGLAGGEGLSFEIARPRLLRAEIAEALRTALR